MQEKPSRYAITRRPKATATLLAAGEIDLRRVLCRHNPTPFTGSRRAMRQCLNHLAARDRGRRQEPMDRNLPRPRPPQFANDQRAGLHHPLDQRVADRRSPRITKMTQSSTPNRHLVPHRYSDHGESEPRRQGKQNM